MTAIPFRHAAGHAAAHVTGRIAVLAAVVLLTSGCGLSEELDRERDPGRTAPAEEDRSTAEGGVAAPTGPDSPTGDPVQTAPPEVPGVSDAPSASCPASGVRIEAGIVSAAMGLRAMSVTLTNCGKDTYRLKGYPKLRVLDEHREPLDVQILEGTEPIMTRDDDPGAHHSVSLKRGQQAYTVLAWRNTVTDTTTTAVSGTYLKVTPAPGTSPATVTPEGRIDLGNTGRIGTTAWQRSPADETDSSRPTAPAPSTPAS
ncbi:DUF4232 domain-containing protein [Streptomyces sp. NPDC058268]|uniref:DUF4232 domain-containing protein n=1 Tax=Streptomyces sp. NPDC058268 TaxID=3346413 RepID=UPI0036E4E61B